MKIILISALVSLLVSFVICNVHKVILLRDYDDALKNMFDKTKETIEEVLTILLTRGGKKLKSPCKDCPRRRVTATYNCHSSCKEYRCFAEQQEKARKRRKIEGQINGFVVESIMANLKRSATRT